MRGLLQALGASRTLVVTSHRTYKIDVVLGWKFGAGIRAARPGTAYREIQQEMLGMIKILWARVGYHKFTVQIPTDLLLGPNSAVQMVAVS